MEFIRIYNYKQRRIQKINIKSFEGVDLSTVDVNNIQPNGMSKQAANNNFNGKVNYYNKLIKILGGKEIDDNIQFEFLKSLKTTLSKGDITNIEKFVNQFASLNKLNSKTNDALYKFTTAIAGDNKLELADISKSMMASMLLQTNRNINPSAKDIKKVIEIINKYKTIDEIANKIDNLGLAPKFNTADFKALMSVFDENENNTITKKEYNNKSLTLLDKTIEYMNHNI